MKKVAVFTYCEWNSYGSILQAFGLMKALRDFGVHETIYKSFHMESPLNKKIKKGLRSRLLFLVSLFYLKKINRVYENNTHFIESNFDIVYFNGFDELKNGIPKSDLYITGSDQVWNPTVPLKELFLDFDTYDKKRVSYAASFGVLDIPGENKEYIQTMLNSFTEISVREKSMVPIISSLEVHVEPQVHIDPTFLLTRSEWKMYEKQRDDVPERYILVYAIYWDKKYNEKLIKLSEETHLPIISIQLSKRSVFSHKKIYDCDVTEFIWLVDHAEFVVTSSFHGLAFSIIFNKKFSVLINPDAPSRLNDLMEFLSLNNCPVEKLNVGFTDNYTETNRIIEHERERSLDYLKHCIE